MLRLNLEVILAKFASLLLDVQIALENKDVKITHVRQFLVNSSQGDLNIPICADFASLFDTLRKQKVWTYQHSTPLEMLAEKFLHDDHDIQERIRGYKGDLSGFLVTTKLIEYIKLNPLSDEEMDEEEESTPPPKRTKLTKQQYRSLKVVLNLETRKISDLSLDYVHEVWKKFAEEFDLPLLTTLIRKIVCGSLEITWFVLHHIMEMIEQKLKTPKAVKFFRNHKIVSLAVDNVIVFDEQQMVSSC